MKAIAHSHAAGGGNETPPTKYTQCCHLLYPAVWVLEVIAVWVLEVIAVWVLEVIAVQPQCHIDRTALDVGCYASRMTQMGERLVFLASS